MSAILGIETSTMTASVAALVDGSLVACRDGGVDSHSGELLHLIDAVLGEAGVALGELDTIAIGAGPGSFTGLRIGMATAKGLCFATGVSLTPVSSLAALALDGADADGSRDALVVPVMDARRREVFAGFYRLAEGRAALLAPERVLAPAALPEVIAELADDAPVRLCGDGFARYRALLEAAGVAIEGARTTPSGGAVARLATGCEPVDLLAAAPAYLRKAEAEIKFPDGNTGGTFSR